MLAVNSLQKKDPFFLTTDLCMVQPGMLVANARRYAGRKRRVGAYHSGNLRQIASVITRRRVYNLEFTDYSDLKSFYNMIEAVFASSCYPVRYQGNLKFKQSF